ncbi:MAG: HlyD family efflux transporter periplasmic adaptor subunit [Aquabacterium sp.]
MPSPTLSLSAPLPLLRQELALLPGPLLPDGQPSHTLHDPVRNLFFQIDWPTFEALRRWHLGSAQAVAAEVSDQTTLHLDAHDIHAMADFFRQHELTQVPPGQARDLAAGLAARHGHWLTQLLHHYLFFRIPLIKPDRWLSRWAPRLDFLYARWALVPTLAALGWGLMEIHRQWERFSATLVDHISLSGLLGYGAAIAFVKVLHELGHAITAKRLGCRVPTMGVAFLVLWPVAYTDTNEVWKLNRRQDRLAVGAAGVLTEMAVAAWATLAWALLPDGTPKSLAFVLATTTLISTLLLNSSPFMRFDGYFVLSDWLQIPNLHDRAFALARWDLRERLFGLGLPAPEAFPPARRTGLILFAYATWAYRLAVFLGIAALVYTFFIKAVGILLFAVEIGWFVLRPIWRELAVWRAAWPVLRQRSRSWRTAAVLAMLGGMLLLPWPTRPSASALLRPAAQYVVYAPPHARLITMPPANGRPVKAGEPLLLLASPELASRMQAAQAHVRQLRWQASATAFDPDQRARWQVLQEELSAAEADLSALQADARRYAPVAPFDGEIRDVPPDLQAGAWLSTDEALARLITRQGHTVTAYIDEDELPLIQPGDTARFYADAPSGPSVPLTVVRIEADATRVLPEHELAHLFGAGIVVREKNGLLMPERPVYRVTLQSPPDLHISEMARQHAWRGSVVFHGRWTAPGWRYIRHAAAVIRREAGF